MRPTLKIQFKKYTRNEVRANCRTFTLSAALFFSLCSCVPERFRHEKYDCSNSLGNPSTIVLSKSKPGQFAKVTWNGQEEKANVTRINDEIAVINYKKIKIKIERYTGAVALIQGKNYRKSICIKSVFKM